MFRECYLYELRDYYKVGSNFNITQNERLFMLDNKTTLQLFSPNRGIYKLNVVALIFDTKITKRFYAVHLDCNDISNLTITNLVMASKLIEVTAEPEVKERLLRDIRKLIKSLKLYMGLTGIK